MMDLQLTPYVQSGNPSCWWYCERSSTDHPAEEMVIIVYSQIVAKAWHGHVLLSLS